MSKGLEIQLLQPDDPNVDLFNQVPANIYDGLVMASGVFERKHLQKLIVILLDKVPVARAAIYCDPLVMYNDKKVAFFGYFESVNNPGVFSALFEQIQLQAARLQAAYSIGPINGNTWNQYRFRLTDRPGFFTEAIDQPYYAPATIDAGYSILHRYFTSIGELKSYKHITCDNFFEEQRISCRSIDLSNFVSELRTIYDLSMTAFRSSPFFSFISDEDFIAKYLPLQPFLDPDLVLLAERDGQLLAFVLAYPDRFNRQQLIIKTVAKSDSAPKALITMMVYKIYTDALHRGFSHVLHAYMHESNRSLMLSENFGGSVYQEYGLFIREV